MSVKEYAFKFTLLSKYTRSIVTNLRDKMNRFLSGVSDMVAEESCTAMLFDNMYISFLVSYA